MTFEIWEAPNEMTMCWQKDRERSLIPEDAELIHSLEADDYNTAMTACHKFLEWEPYLPYED